MMVVIFLGNDKSFPLYKEFIEQTKTDKPDIVVSCQFGQRVPEKLIRTFPTVNVHYGALPRYAGCSPVYWQILEGDVAGVTLHYMDKNFDSGDIIDQTLIQIGTKTADEVYDELAEQGVLLLKKHYHGIVMGTAPRRKQDLTLRRYKTRTAVDFNKEIMLGECPMFEDRKIRALSFKGKQYPILTINGRNYEIRPCEVEK